MGCYVEVQNKSKWLVDNCTHGWVKPIPKWEDFREGELPVVLVDNGYFLAAGVAFDKQEYERFTYPEDLRPKIIYSVPLEKLKEVSDVENWINSQ